MSNIVILDTETTGIDDPGLVEFACVAVDYMGSPSGATIDERYNPGKPISWGAMATHHIRDEDVADAPPAKGFKAPSAQYWIGHNIDFDWKVLGSPDVKRICTLALARRMWPDMDSHSLSACLYRVLGAEARPMLRDAHSAAADVGVLHVRAAGHLQGPAAGQHRGPVAHVGGGADSNAHHLRQAQRRCPQGHPARLRWLAIAAAGRRPVPGEGATSMSGAEPMPGESFWLVWNLDRGVPTYRHDSRASAEKEAERLASANPGQIFYVVIAESAYRHVTVDRTTLFEPVPF